MTCKPIEAVKEQVIGIVPSYEKRRSYQDFVGRGANILGEAQCWDDHKSPGQMLFSRLERTERPSAGFSRRRKLLPST